jgi:hypothetical protein
MASEWVQSLCDSHRWRYLDDGTIELDGEGVITYPWKPGVDAWKVDIQRAASKFQLPPSWIAGLMAFESGGNTDAGSPAGAQGLMQLMPGTAQSMADMYGIPYGGASTLKSDPATNVMLGAAYLAYQVGRYNDFVHAAAGYNAGSARCWTEACATATPESAWGYCTDGSPYPRWAIGHQNTAVLQGFNAPVLFAGAGLAGVLAFGVAAYAGYELARWALGRRGIRLPEPVARMRKGWT